MEVLIGLFCLALLIAILVRIGTLSGEVERLKRRLGELERNPEQTPQSPAKPVEAAVTPPPITKPRPAAVPEKATAPPAPPPLPKPKREAFEPWVHLRRLGLWPPVREEGSAELVLMQWWMPRIGGGLAILTIIFFAVYVAQGTPPWVKFLEMLVASAGVFALGLFFSKKRPGLGNVLIATGLSMIYISSVAGYAVGPVKVTDNPLVGALMQVGALILNFGMGTWRKNRGILVLALIFGYVSSLFAALEGFREAALLSSLFVYLAGIFSYRRIGGLTLATLSLAGVYLPLAGFIGIKYLKDAPVYPEFWSAIVFLMLTVSIFPACKLVLKEPPFVSSNWNRLFQSLNTSLAIGLGYLFVNEFYPLGKTEFYGVTAILFVCWSLIWFARDSRGIEFHLFFLKGSALTSLWFINYYGGDLRWMTLGVQVIILATAVHRAKSVWVELITGATWLASFFYFIQSGLNEAIWSFLWFIQAVYILVSVAGLAYLMAYVSGKQSPRKVVYLFPALFLAGAAMVFAAESNVRGLDEPGVVALMGFLMLLIAAIPFFRPWVPLLSGGLVFLGAHLMFWFEPSGKYTLLALLFVSACCLFGLLKAKIARQNFAETFLHLLWVITLSFYFNTLAGQSWYPILIAAFSLLLFFGGYTPLKRLPEVCAVPLLFLIIHPPTGEPHGIILLIFGLMVGGLANLGVVVPGFRGFTVYLKRGHMLWWILNALFIYWVDWSLVRTVSLTQELLVWTGLAAVCFLLWYRRMLWVSFVASLFCAAVPVYHITGLWLNPPAGGLLDGAPWAWQVLLAGLCSTALWLGIGGAARVWAHGKYSPSGEQLLAWASGLTAYLVYAATFDYPLLNWERLYTPCLAAFSIILIVFGIVLKSKPYRFVAMLTFLVPLFRLFVYDIRETLFRIIAFAVLAVLLTVVGFLYQKFSSRIE